MTVPILGQGPLCYSVKRQIHPSLPHPSLPHPSLPKGHFIRSQSLEFSSLHHFVVSYSMSLGDLRSLKLPVFYDTKQPELRAGNVETERQVNSAPLQFFCGWILRILALLLCLCCGAILFSSQSYSACCEAGGWGWGCLDLCEVLQRITVRKEVD